MKKTIQFPECYLENQVSVKPLSWQMGLGKSSNKGIQKLCMQISTSFVTFMHRKERKTFWIFTPNFFFIFFFLFLIVLLFFFLFFSFFYSVFSFFFFFHDHFFSLLFIFLLFLLHFFSRVLYASDNTFWLKNSSENYPILPGKFKSDINLYFL